MRKVKARDQVPPGSYRAALEGYEDVEHAEYGPGLRWDWRITAGRHKGEIVSRTVKDEATLKNAFGGLLTTLTGLPFDRARKVDLDDYIGTDCHVVVRETDSGSTRVESFIPVRQPGENEADPNDELSAAAEEEDAPFGNDD